jgi:ubiquinone/menaquinone biosynthesis C-methylase UbiE
MQANTTPVRLNGAEAVAAIPDYLHQVYHWAYIHPRSVRLLDRHWVVNTILWGNYRRLRNAALDALGERIAGRTLQLACVYGDFTNRLAGRLAPDATLDVVDVLPIQLHNLGRKVAGQARMRLIQCDSSRLDFAPDASYDQVLLFFLLHEQPGETRRATLREAFRVVKPGGRVVIMDYHQPAAWHPLRYVMYGILRWLEPFALDLWQADLASWMPHSAAVRHCERMTLFGGLYQRVVVRVSASPH